MKNTFFTKYALAPTFAFLVVALVISSCQKDDDPNDFPITNDFRVLQVRNNGDVISSGVSGISVIPELELVFSHAVSTTALESALTASPIGDYTISFDSTESIGTLSFPVPLDYESVYTIGLPNGTYGKNGEASIEPFSFEFTTASFEPPSLTFTADAIEFFEGETITISAAIDVAILEDVTMDLVFDGTAENGVDYTPSGMSISIPSGSTSGSVELEGISDGVLEGAEQIVITLQNVVNAEENQPQEVSITLGDLPPSLELKGVMELDNYIDGSDGRVRAIHLRVLEDISNLGTYGVEIASNGATPDPNDIDFIFPDNTSASAGDELFIVRDQDEANAIAYFGSCYNDFTIFLSDAITQNGDDAILLYNGGVAIESFGEPGIDGTDQFWDYTDSWAYKVGSEWVYAGAGCVENAVGAATDATSICKYPFCSPIQFQGISALLWDGSGTNGGKAVHLRVNRDIDDLSQYSLGVANNGGGTDGIEYTLPGQSASEGDHILVAREPVTIASYFGACYNQYDHVFQADAMSQNGDDAQELFDGMDVIETYGDANVDGTGEVWEYAGSWAYKIGGSWTYGGLDCATTSTSTQSSACTYPFCN